MTLTCPWCTGSPHSVVETAEGQGDWRACSSCGSLVNLDPAPDDATTYGPASGYYTQSESLDHRGGGWAIGEALRARAAFAGRWPFRVPPLLDAFIRARVRPGQTLLDWGCGSGMYVELARLYGIEAEGYDPFNPQFETMPQRSSWDVVMIRHALEHTARPLDEIARLPRAEKLLLSIPVAWSPQYIRERAAWQMLTKIHPHLPTSFALVRAMEVYGWRCADHWLEDNGRGWTDGSSGIFVFRSE